MSKDKKTPKIAQVDSASLREPAKPSMTEPEDKNYQAELDKLNAAEKEIKKMRALLMKGRKQVVGGKKLKKMREFAHKTTEWAVTQTEKFAVSVDRANTAVGNLQEYEKKLAIPEKDRKCDALVKALTDLTAVRELIKD